MEETDQQQSMFARYASSRTARLITLGVVLVILLSGGIGYYFYSKAKRSPQQAQQQEIADLVAAVGKLIVLPADEQPVIATVADPEKLSGQPFFANAQKGSKVLIYNRAQKAILYDPVANRIINVAPFTFTMTPTPVNETRDSR